MKDVLELFIPIVAIIMTMLVPIAWFYFDHRTKDARYRAMERIAASGQDPKLLERMLAAEPSPSHWASRRQPYRSGLFFMALGGAFLFADSEFHDGPPAWVGVLFLFLGIARLLSDFLNRKNRPNGQNGSGPQDPQLPA